MEVRPPPGEIENEQVDVSDIIRKSLWESEAFFPPENEIYDDTSVLHSEIQRNDYSHLPPEPSETRNRFKKPKRKRKKTRKITGKKRKRVDEEDEVEEEIKNESPPSTTTLALLPGNKSGSFSSTFQKALVRLEKRRRVQRTKKPEWHPPWKLYRVLSGHLGWVRALSVDVTNDFFVSGSADRTIKVWDLASGRLRLTLTGHSNTIRDMVLSPRHPYLFSVGEDKAIKVWDLEQNKCIKAFHGHLSGIYCCDLHPSIDVLVTGARDSTARVWDIRTKAEVMLLTGHNGVVGSIRCQGVEPQIITGSMDATVRLWDMTKGLARTILTHHKKSVRALTVHPTEYTFASAAADRMKKWLCPEGKFIGNFDYPLSTRKVSPIMNSLCINNNGVMVAGSNDGRLLCYDWKTGANFQDEKVKVQSGSLQAEAGILVTKFDKSGSRLLTGEVDKTIKMWKEDDKASPTSHPIPERDEDEQYEYW